MTDCLCFNCRLDPDKYVNSLAAERDRCTRANTALQQQVAAVRREAAQMERRISSLAMA